MPDSFNAWVNEPLAKQLRGHIFEVLPSEPHGIVPWWPGRVAWKRDAELVVNQLSLYPRSVGRIHWRIFRVPSPYPLYAVKFWANVLEEA